MHLGTALDYRQAWDESRWVDLIRTTPRPGHPQYPFAYHYTLLPLLGSQSPHRAVVFLNLLYFLLFVGSAAWIAWQLAQPGGESWAAAAVLIVAGLSPGLMEKFREAFPDLALAAWTALAYALIVRSRGFTHKGWSVAAGLAAGLAVLSKWGAVLYLLPAAVWALRSRESRRHLGLAMSLAAAMALPWYLINTPAMLPRIWNSVTLGHKQGHPLTWTWANWWFYPRWLVDCFGAPALALLAGGMLWALRGFTPARLCVAAWFAFSYLFCTLVPSKDYRYFLPAAVALPALTLSSLPGPALALSAGLALWHSRQMRRPDPGAWPAEEVLAEIEKRGLGPGRSATLCVLANHEYLNATSLTWLARHRGLKGLHFGGYQSELPEWSDFVLVKTGHPGVFLSDATHGLLAQERDPGSFFRSVFIAARRWPLPDGSQAVLYQPKSGLALLSGQRRFPELTVRKARLFDVALKPLGPGRFELRASRVELPKLDAPIRDLRAELSGARLLEREGRLYVLGLEKVRLLRARQDGRELAQALSRRSGLPIALSTSDGALMASTRLGPLTLELSLTTAIRDGDLHVGVRGARLAGLSLPLPSLNLRRSLGPRPPSQPYALELAPIRLSAERLSIGS